MDLTFWFPKNMGAGGGVKERTESWGCPATAGLPLGFLKNPGGRVEWKSTQKVEGADKLLHMPRRFRKKMGAGEETDRKLSVPINSWTSTSISKKNWGSVCVKERTESWRCRPSPGLVTSISKNWGGGREIADWKLRVPTISWTCHFDFEKMGGACLKERTESWGCPRTPGFATLISQNKLGGGRKSTQKVERAHQLLDFDFHFEKIGGGRVEWKGTQKAEGAQQLLDFDFDFQKMGGEWSEKAHRKLRVPTNSWICHFDFPK